MTRHDTTFFAPRTWNCQFLQIASKPI